MRNRCLINHHYYILKNDLVYVEALALKMLNWHNDWETQTKHSDSVYLAIFTSLKQYINNSHTTE